MLNSQLIHNLVAKARTSLLGLACTVTHKTIVSKDAYGKIRWSAGVTIQAFASKQQKKVTLSDGREVVSGFQITIPDSTAVVVTDCIVMPDGSTPPILQVLAPLDDQGQPYMTEVYF